MNSSLVQSGVALAQAIALLMSVAFITYVLVMVATLRRYRTSPPGDAGSLQWHLFVPALNEEQVIGGTIDFLRATFPGAHVWVIDDASDDRTADIVGVRARSDPMVHAVSRRFPEARTGKGAALNAAYQALSEWLPPGADHHQTVVGVIDADGRPAQNCLSVCAGEALFGDPKVDSVQILVRMMNRDDRKPFPRRGRLANAFGQGLVRMQDIEFRVPISAIQITRRLTRTVGLGGNGQFSRMSALNVVADETGAPWRGALLEDYELGLHLLMTGHRNEYTRDTYVDQEGLPDIRRLIRQRTRWGQGTMQCGTYLPQLWSSPYVTKLGALEATYYLVQPWLQIVGTIVYPIPAAVFLANYATGPSAISNWLISGGWMLLFFYLAVGIGPFVLWGPIYWWRCERGVGIIRAIGLGIGFSFFVLIFYVTSWRAFLRVIRRREDWFKTRRNAEFLSDTEHEGQRTPALHVISAMMGDK